MWINISTKCFLYYCETVDSCLYYGGRFVLSISAGTNIHFPYSKSGSIIKTFK